MCHVVLITLQNLHIKEWFNRIAPSCTIEDCIRLAKLANAANLPLVAL